MDLSERYLDYRSAPFSPQECACVNAGAEAIGVRATLVGLIAHERNESVVEVLFAKARARGLLEACNLAFTRAPIFNHG